MHRRTACFIAKTNCHHLHHAALVGCHEIRVGLDAVADDDTVGLISSFVKIYRCTIGGVPKQNSFHGSFHRTTHSLLTDAIMVQYFPLSLSGGAAMTSHSRNNEWISSLFPDIIHHTTGDLCNIRNPSAADRNCNMLIL